MRPSIHYIRFWLVSGIVLISAMVIVGGITRLTGSGLSIVEWKPVTGTIPPLNEHDWEQEFEKYKQFPQYQLMNYHMTLGEFKEIFFWEYIHRLLGRLIGVIFIFPFMVFWLKGWIQGKLMYALVIIFLLGGLQGFAGWYMVKSGLISMPHVSHFRLAVHQGLAMLLIGALQWTALSLDQNKNLIQGKSRLLFTMTIISLILLAGQISLGALVAGLKAGLSYTNFPMMADSFFPSESLITSNSFFYNGAVLQFVHRWLAFFVLTSFILLYFLSIPHPALRATSKWLVMLGAFQIALGIITLLLSVPVAMGVAHQFAALLILIVMIKLLHTQLYSGISFAEK